LKTTVSIAALCAIATAAVLGFGAAPSDATVSCDRYAATSGSDGAAGTSAAPVRTAQKLANCSSATASRRCSRSFRSTPTKS
jgi:hypothetical protein